MIASPAVMMMTPVMSVMVVVTEMPCHHFTLFRRELRGDRGEGIGADFVDAVVKLLDLCAYRGERLRIESFGFEHIMHFLMQFVHLIE